MQELKEMSRTGEFTNHVDDLLHLLEDVCGEITDVKKFDEFDLYECARNGEFFAIYGKYKKVFPLTSSAHHLQWRI